jgi:leucyl aminopeptidase (aminopeptidase T)
MPFTTPDEDKVHHIFEDGGMTADYIRLRENVESFSSLVDGTEEVRVTSPEGTDIVLTVDSDKLPWDIDHGVIHEPGGFTNLPAGEVYCAPSDARGVIVVDGSFGDWGLVPEPMRLEVENRRVTRFEGGFSDRLEEYVGKLGKDVLNVAELGFGLNPRSEVIGVILEDEKAGGTVHIALGNNASFGGDVDVGFHFDGLIRHPVVELDRELVDMKKYLD